MGSHMGQNTPAPPHGQLASGCGLPVGDTGATFSLKTAMDETGQITLQLLIDENCKLLQQGIDLVDLLPEAIYAQNVHEHFSSGVGRHFRHILDFYDRFSSGSPGQIDYDARERDARVETDPGYGQDRASRAIASLEKLQAVSTPQSVEVRVETCSPDGVGLATTSSIERELAHLASHTVHHYAIIRMILSLLGTKVSDDFGVAPSTLRFENRLPGA